MSISSFVRREQCVVIIEEYDRNILYPMLVKCHEHLHPLVRSYRNYVDYDVFEHIANISELVKEFVKKELLIFK
jgi:hypothetical protein